MGDPRAAVFAAQQTGVPSLVLCAASRQDDYLKATQLISIGPQVDAALLLQQLRYLGSMGDDSRSDGVGA